MRVSQTFQVNQRHNVNTESAVAILDDREFRTTRLPFKQAIVEVSPDGLFGGERSVTKAGLRAVCDTLSPGLHGFLKGIERQRISTEAKRAIQMRTINDAIYYFGHRGDGFTVTATDGAIDAVYGQRYGLETNRNIFNMAVEMYQDHEQASLESFSLHGRAMHLTFTDSEKSRTLYTERAPLGEAVKSGITVINSEDRSTALEFSASLWLMFCTNGAISRSKVMCARARHIGNTMSHLKGRLGDIDASGLSGMLDMLEHSTRIKIGESELDRHQNWVAKRHTSTFALRHVSKDVAFKTYGGRQEDPSVFDVFNSITEAAHNSGLSTPDQVKLEAMGMDYLRWAS